MNAAGRLCAALGALPGVQAATSRFGARDRPAWRIAGREIAHLHSAAVIDLRLPPAMQHRLRGDARARFRRHRSPWIEYKINSDEGIAAVVSLVRELAQVQGSFKAELSMNDRDLTRGYPRTQFVAKLRRLADAIENGKPFAIQVAGEQLRIPADVTFNIEHERAGADEELEFQLLWRRRAPRPTVQRRKRGQ